MYIHIYIQESRSTCNNLRSTVANLEETLHKSDDQIREVNTHRYISFTSLL